MRVLLQWAQRNPRDWVETNSSQWSQLPSLGVPAPGQLGGSDNRLGWVHRLNCQGVVFIGDHYAVEDLPPDGCRVTVWWDDPDSYPDGEWYARQWTFLDPAPDDRIGGAINTRQYQVVYAQPVIMQTFSELLHAPIDELDTAVENCVFRPWSEFVPPSAAATRHGVWVPDALSEALELAQSVRGWREWVGG